MTRTEALIRLQAARLAAGEDVRSSAHSALLSLHELERTASDELTLLVFDPEPSDRAAVNGWPTPLEAIACSIDRMDQRAAEEREHRQRLEAQLFSLLEQIVFAIAPDGGGHAGH